MAEAFDDLIGAGGPEPPPGGGLGPAPGAPAGYGGFGTERSLEGLTPEQKDWTIDYYRSRPGVGSVYVDPSGKSLRADMRTGAIDEEGKPVGGGGGALSAVTDYSKRYEAGKGIMLDDLETDPKYAGLRPEVRAKIRQRISEWAETERAFSLAEEASATKRDRLMREAANTAMSDYWTRIIKAKLGNDPKFDYDGLTREIIADPRFIQDREAKRTLSEAIAKDAGENDLRHYGRSFPDYLLRVYAAPGDPGQITDARDIINAYSRHELTVAGADKLLTELARPKSPEGEAENKLKLSLFEQAKTELTGADPRSGLKDPFGEDKYMTFLGTFFGEYAAGLRDKKTPLQLLSPQSPDYLGTKLLNAVKPERLEREAPGAKKLEDKPPPPSMWQNFMGLFSHPAPAPFDANTIRTMPNRDAQRAALTDAVKIGKIDRRTGDSLAVELGLATAPPPPAARGTPGGTVPSLPIIVPPAPAGPAGPPAPPTPTVPTSREPPPGP